MANVSANRVYQSWLESLRLVKEAASLDLKRMWLEELERDQDRARALIATGHLEGQAALKMDLILSRSVKESGVMLRAGEKPVLG